MLKGAAAVRPVGRSSAMVTAPVRCAAGLVVSETKGTRMVTSPDGVTPRICAASVSDAENLISACAIALGLETLRSFRVRTCPGAPEAGDIDVIAGAPTATVADWEAAPHGPVAVIVKTVVAFTETVALPPRGGLATEGEIATVSALATDQ